MNLKSLPGSLPVVLTIIGAGSLLPLNAEALEFMVEVQQGDTAVPYPHITSLSGVEPAGGRGIPLRSSAKPWNWNTTT